MMTAEPSFPLQRQLDADHASNSSNEAPNLSTFSCVPLLNLNAKILPSVEILLCRILINSHDLSSDPCSNIPFTQNRAAVSTAISWAANTLRMSTDSTESKAKFYSDRSSLELL